uniref:Uncharacterized protein n=1 Tax=Panagrolaimus sp. JU765 TaxID=591449 RepID=A0AC34PXS1_9BILA
MSFHYVDPEKLSESERLTISTVDYLKSKGIKKDKFGKPVFVFLNFNHPVFKKARRGECRVKMIENGIFGISKKFIGQITMLSEHGILVIEPHTHNNVGWVFNLQEAELCSSECNSKYVKDGFLTRRQFKNETILKFSAGKVILKFKGYGDNSDWFQMWNSKGEPKPAKKRLIELLNGSDVSCSTTS